MNTIWTRHFLDSIVPVPFISFDNKRILDFGTGGGLPGIPIAILYPKADMSLLDSRKKKIGAIQIVAQQLQCTNCSFFSCRIEEMGDQYTESFDIIVCRSVKMIPKYKKIVLNLLKPGGKLILYKSKNIDDIAIFNNAIIHDKSTEQLGERKIIEIVKDTTL
jgi:16S rRNA (guanine527-N7)-methyltransferase